jgi:hypothetical protein
MVTPYAAMSDGVYGKDTSIHKATCPTAKEIDYSKRVIKLDESPRPSYYGGKDNPYEVFRVLEEWKLDKDFYLGMLRARERKINLQKRKIYKKL